MRILQLCKKFPYPLKDGESIAVSYLARGLKQAGAELTLLVMNTHKHHFNVASFPEDENPYEEIIEVPLDNRLKPIPALLNLFSGNSYHLSRYDFKAFRKALSELLSRKSFDIFLLETFYLSPYVESFE